MPSLTEIQDRVARAAFGMTMAEAKADGICICCKQPPKFTTGAGRREYYNSALCEPCFDRIAQNAEDAEEDTP